MTRAEAVKILKGIAEEAGAYPSAVSYVASDEDVEALNMAIEALEREPCDKRTDKRTETHTCDCIRRQAAIEAICEDGTMFERQGQYSMTMAERKQRDTDILDALPSAQPFTEEQIQTMQELESAQVEKAYELGKADRPKWISCGERLPKKDGRYQVTRHDDVTNTEFIDILWYEENLWWNRHSTGDYAVTAWMPLPEAYREDGEEE